MFDWHHSDEPPFGYVVIVGIVASVCILLLWGITAARNPDEASPSNWPGPTNGQSTSAQDPVANPVPNGTAGGQIRPDIDDGLFPGETQLPARLDQILADVSERVGYGLASPITAAFTADANCNLRGLAFTEERVAQVFTCTALGSDVALAIMAHEIVHLLADDRYGAYATGGDIVLVEGLATYGAGSYWLAGHPDFRSYVRAQRAGGAVYALTDTFGLTEVDAMNASYYQWASFVEYLRTIGTAEQFDALYVTGTGDPGTADYERIYGKSFTQLADEWQLWVDQ